MAVAGASRPERQALRAQGGVFNGLSDTEPACPDAARMRANLVLDVDLAAVPERHWEGRDGGIGASAAVRIGPPMPRCVMVNPAQPVEGLPSDTSLLRTLGWSGDVEFGHQATVLRPGRVSVGDDVSLP